MPALTVAAMLSADTVNEIRALTERFWRAEVRSDWFSGRIAGKEFGQRIAHDVELRTVEAISARFTPSEAPGGEVERGMGDMWLTEHGRPHPINIKAGDAAKETGKPNVVALNRLLNALLAGEIDSYYLLIVKIDRDALSVRVDMVDVLDHLGFIHYNAGPGQIKLYQKPFYAALDGGYQPPQRPLIDKIDYLLELERDADERLITARLARQAKHAGMREQYLSTP